MGLECMGEMTRGQLKALVGRIVRSIEDEPERWTVNLLGRVRPQVTRFDHDGGLRVDFLVRWISIDQRYSGVSVAMLYRNTLFGRPIGLYGKLFRALDGLRHARIPATPTPYALAMDSLDRPVSHTGTRMPTAAEVIDTPRTMSAMCQWVESLSYADLSREYRSAIRRLTATKR